jgi:hypothetical protein
VLLPDRQENFEIDDLCQPSDHPSPTMLSAAHRHRKNLVALPLPIPLIPQSGIALYAPKCQWFLEPTTCGLDGPRWDNRCVWVFGILRSREGEIAHGRSAPFYDGVVGGHGGLRYVVRVSQTRGLLQHGVSEDELMLPGAGGSHSDACSAAIWVGSRIASREYQEFRARRAVEPVRTANWALAMDHSRGGMIHSFSERVKTRRGVWSRRRHWGNGLWLGPPAGVWHSKPRWHWW